MIGPSSTPGWSVAKVRSTTIATSGSWANALVREPANVVSSWATASASTSPGRAALLRDQPGRLGGDVAADAVVERARDDAPVAKLDRARVDHRDVADPHQLARLVAVLGADVDVQVLELGRLLAVLVLEQVDRLAADHARAPGRCAWSARPAGRSARADPSRRPGRTADTRRRRCARRAGRSRRCDRRSRRSGRRRCRGTRANDDPTRSPPTSAANSPHHSRQTRAGSVSCPEGPVAVSRRWRNSGIGTGQGYCSGARRGRELSRCCQCVPSTLSIGPGPITGATGRAAPTRVWNAVLVAASIVIVGWLQTENRL